MLGHGQVVQDAEPGAFLGGGGQVVQHTLRPLGDARRTGTDGADRPEREARPHTVEFLLSIVPTSVIRAFAENALLQVLFFAVLFGLGLAKLGASGPPVLYRVIDQSSHIFFTIIGWIMKLAPIGAFGAMAYIIGTGSAHWPATPD
jgi:Na+/H+-dicarboxylate symporter